MAVLLASRAILAPPCFTWRSHSHCRVEIFRWKRRRYKVFSGYSGNGEGGRSVVCGLDDAENETLGLLDWPLVCEQVSGFCATPMGACAARDGNLPIGRSVKESEVLQAQTGDAERFADVLKFEGANDLEELVENAEGSCFGIGELWMVKDTLDCAQRLNNELSKVKKVEVSPLQRIMEGIDLCRELVKDIEKCLDGREEIILDRASPKLAQVRRNRQHNMKKLEATIREAAREVVNGGGYDFATITSRRRRLCVAVKTSHRFLVPHGVVLDSSSTGATLYMEPEDALQLNNLEIQLSATEQEEEFVVLKWLTSRVSENAANIAALSDAIMLLDLACARVKHAEWLGGVRPAFCGGKGVDIEQIRHPLLLGTALRKGQDHPVPVDIKVKPEVRVIVISGPNTGGKTVALKTLGVATLMAKAGLYLPASGKPELPWFDRVFADVGDSQSLEQNLSTFSGHIRRLCRILEGSGSESLVLIDEIGGGTDPSEGSSLATAVLKYLARTVRLCLVTTHSASLKTLPINQEDQSFENASVEFDLKTLRPTYRIIWGVPGESNALNIAKSLQFDSTVLERANYWVTKLTPSGLENRQSGLMLQLTRQADEEQKYADSAAAYLSEIQNLHREIVAEADDLESRKAASKRLEVALMRRRVDEAKAKAQQIVSKFSQGTSKTTTRAAAQKEITSIIAEYGVSMEEKFPRSKQSPPPVVGEIVFIRKLGKKPAVVTEAADEKGILGVRLGGISMRIKSNEVVRARPAVGSRKLSTQKAATKVSHQIQFAPAVQTSENTIDLRGLSVVEAIQVVHMELAERKPGSVLFIIHGIGTGAVKQAVVKLLGCHGRVARFEAQSSTNSGCTVAYIL